MKRITLISIFCTGMLTVSSDVQITDYVASRDKAAIVSMLKDDSKFLAYDDNELCTIYKIESDINQTKVIRKNDETIGFCSYEKYPDEFTGTMYLVAVDKNHRKKGYASKLIQLALDDFEIKRVQEVEICVHYENESALALYQNKFKFKRVYDNNEKFMTLFRTQTLKNKSWFGW